MEALSPRRPGRPRSAAARSAAERMRAYRLRLRERGIRARTILEASPLLEALRFKRDSLLTPGEQEVLRRFCGGFERLPELPAKVAVFGSRAKGGSNARSDLDVAVFMGGKRSAATESALLRIAYAAQQPYREKGCGIFLKPVAFFRGEAKSLREAILPDLEVVWTRPR